MSERYAVQNPMIRYAQQVGWQAEPPKPGQAWSRWTIRLYKAARSLQLFGYTEEFDSLKAFALSLLQRGESLHYGNSDFAVLFTEGRPRR
jgi:hypothetical protein